MTIVKKAFHPVALTGFLVASLVSLASPLAAASSEGKAVYQQFCQACHQVGGKGVPGAFPPVANNSNINNNPSYLAEVIVKGVSGPLEVNGKQYNGFMPAMGYMSNQQVADVVNYILSEMNDSGKTLSEDEVQSLR